MEATYDINLGTDHRCVRLDLRIEMPSSSQNKSRCLKAKPNLRGWTPTDPAEYRNALDDTLKNSIAEVCESIEDQCLKIEDLLLEVGRKTQMAEEEEMNTSHDLREKLADLISERKLARNPQRQDL